MSPFMLRAKLITPCIFNRPVGLVGLVYHAAFLHTADEEKALNLTLSLFKITEGVVHGSCLVFGVNSNSPVIACNRSVIGRMRNEIDFDPLLITPNKKGKYTGVIMDGGPTKARLTHYNAYHAPYIIFYGHGDGERIVNLLNNYVAAIGTEANRGAGTIDGWSMKKINIDHSLVDATGVTGKDNINMPLSPLPTEFFETLSGKSSFDFDIENRALTPPYYRSNNLADCVVPPRVSRQLI